ncbi:hypothetical protein D9M71_605880 [compost metagenome]
MRYFDPNTIGLLDDGTHEIPPHAKPLTDEQYEQIKRDLAAGKQLRAADDGSPLLADPRRPSSAELAEMVRLTRLAAYRLESDPLKNEAEYEALKAGSEPDYSAWLAKVEEIKARYPLPA